MIYWNFFPRVTHILTTQNIYMFLTFDILSWNPSLFCELWDYAVWSLNFDINIMMITYTASLM